MKPKLQHFPHISNESSKHLYPNFCREKNAFEIFREDIQCNSQNDRITQIEEDLSQNSSNQGGVMRPNQTAQRFIQLGKHLRKETWEKKSFFGQPASRLYYPHLLFIIINVKAFILISSWLDTPTSVYDNYHFNEYLLSLPLLSSTAVMSLALSI